MKCQEGVWRMVAVAILFLTVSFLSACGGDTNDGNEGELSATSVVLPGTATPVFDWSSLRATPPSVLDGVPAATPDANQVTTADQRRHAQPNELGVIPILQYHLFTTDPSAEDYLTRPIDDFRADLQWLYDHDFHVISMSDRVRDEISAPAGKHPVVLSFDDSGASQFRMIEQPDGSLVIDPNSAVGAMELFFSTHPDFGRGAFFAILNFNCFANPTEPDQWQYCDRKVQWLADNGYEIGNHTIDHQDLLDISDEEFQRQLGEAWAWIEQNVPEAGQLPSVIAMPYGNYPDGDLHQAQRDMLRDGFMHQGEWRVMEGSLMVGSEPAPSPSSATWDKVWIPRIQAFDDELARWLPMFENGGVILYTSDGNPDTVMIPDPLPTWLDGTLDPDLIAASGKTLVQYDPGTGEPTGGTADAPTGWHRRSTTLIS
ncbi:MAG: polysaccharide deacetylase family protein [Chloroflexia bacterium]|nr:polysaccharide deacetylase family protein [Chloroflexia bacterium]